MYLVSSRDNYFVTCRKHKRVEHSQNVRINQNVSQKCISLVNSRIQVCLWNVVIESASVCTTVAEPRTFHVLVLINRESLFTYCRS